MIFLKVLLLKIRGLQMGIHLQRTVLEMLINSSYVFYKLINNHGDMA